MSLYNMIFGTNPIADTLLAIIDLTREDTGRFRDAFLFKGEAGPEIHVYTRNGGGNREEYGALMEHLAAHPLYLGDRDDEFDCTYATIRFRAPDEMREWLAALVAEEDQRTPAQRWSDFFDKLNTKPDDPMVKRALEAAKPMMEALAAATTPRVTGSAKVYSIGVVHASVCSDMPPDETVAAVNLSHPSGTENGWSIDPSPTFADGTPNPCPCNRYRASRKHYLLVC